MPLAKDLAAVLGVNRNTVLPPLRLLRDEGLLEFRRGRGVSVVSVPARAAVVHRARELVDFARRNGYRVDELVQNVQSLWLPRGARWLSGAEVLPGRLASKAPTAQPTPLSPPLRPQPVSHVRRHVRSRPTLA